MIYENVWVFFLDKNRNFVKSKYLFDNFQGVTGDRGPVGNQGSRGYPVSLSLCEQKKRVFCIYVYDRNVCRLSVYLR